MEEEHERMTSALRRVHLSFREVEMASLRQVLGHFRKSGTRAKVLLGARGMFNGSDVLTRMGRYDDRIGCAGLQNPRAGPC